MTPTTNCYNRQKGLALVTVLMATALVSILAVSMTTAQQVSTRRSANLFNSDQARLLAMGLEEWAIQLLLRDRQQNSRDHLGEDWAIGLPPTRVANGEVSGRIIDLQGRFNINNLAADNRKVSDLGEIMLGRLFSLCGARDNWSPVQSVADWLDADNLTRPGGAEDNEYLLKETPYLAGNRLMFSPSEILLVEGADPEKYACMAKDLAALPNPTALNVNTASAPVIAALSENISLAAAEEVEKDRPDTGYDNISAFTSHPSLVGAEISPDTLSLASNFFLVEGNARFGNVSITMFSVLARRPDTVEVVGRSIGVY